MMKLDKLADIVAKLRGPGGCPWDREQTRASLKPFLIEEFYELIDAIEDNDDEGTREELGDLLFQIVLQSQLFSEEGKFGIDEVVDDIIRKMVKRHPHVFGDKEFDTSDEVEKWWKEHKRREGKEHESSIGGVPRTLPALLRAQKLQLKATRVGFDWERIEDAFGKIEEEIKEFREAVERNDRDEIEDELGDLFFVLVRIANYVNVNPEDALRRTIGKFVSRFEYVEAEASRQGRKLSEMTLAEMDVLWNEAKKSL
jgi:tetrapyrrole methylase family protein/MazG family protein